MNRYLDFYQALAIWFAVSVGFIMQGVLAINHLRVQEAARKAPQRARLRRILDQAQYVFSDKEAALEWVSMPNYVLGGITPRTMSYTEDGTIVVLGLLTRMEYGVYS